MKLKIVEKKISLPENVHAYAEKKVTKLERYFRDDAEAFVAFSVQKGRNIVELTVHAANTYFRASESTSDMFASFVRSPEVTSFAPDEPEEGEFEIVRTKRFAIKPMTREEAILQMNLLEHTFFAFKDEEANGAFAVVYKRNDGGYGLIENEE